MQVINSNVLILLALFTEISNVGNADQDAYSYQVTVVDPAMVVVEAVIFADGFE